MAMVRIINCSMLLAIILVFMGCSHPNKPIAGFSDYLSKNGYSFYNPPRAARGAGHAFIVKGSESGKKSVSPICKSVFRDIDISEEALTLSKEEKSQTFSINFFIEFYHDLIENPAALEAELSKNINILAEIESPIEHVIYEEDIYFDDGAPRTFTPQCYSALKNKKERGELEDVFFVQSAIETDKVTYTFSSDSLSSAEVEVKLKDILKLNPGIKYSSTTKNSLVIEKPRYIAFLAYPIEQFIPTGHMGGFVAKIKLKKMRSVLFNNYAPHME